MDKNLEQARLHRHKLVLIKVLFIINHYFVGNNKKIFTRAQVKCSTDDSEAKWTNPLHPVFFPDTKKCVGYVGLPEVPFLFTLLDSF